MSIIKSLPPNASGVVQWYEKQHKVNHFGDTLMTQTLLFLQKKYPED
jgi:hypothetical protein